MKHNKYINKMKNLLKLSLLLLILLPLVSAGQVYKLKSTDYSYRSKLDDDSWSKWEEPTDTNVLITVNGVTRTKAEWARHLEVSYQALKYRLKHWKNISEACTKPKKV